MQNLKDNDLKEINKFDHFLLRKIVGAHSKVPVEFLFLETAGLPIDLILKNRRVNYLHTASNRDKSELRGKFGVGINLVVADDDNQTWF